MGNEKVGLGHKNKVAAAAAEAAAEAEAEAEAAAEEGAAGEIAA